MPQRWFLALAAACTLSAALSAVLVWFLMPKASTDGARSDLQIVVRPDGGASDQHGHIQAAINALPKARKVYATVALEGEFEIERGLRLDSYTLLDLRNARLVLSGSANSSLVQNRAGKKGNHHIKVLGGFLRGNRRERGAEGSSCIQFDNTSHLHIDGIRVSECALDGITVNGHGQHPQHHSLVDLVANNNFRDGLSVTWAVRRASIADISANWNNRHGVYSDHSESSYRNIRAEFNGGDGIYIRNVFNNVYYGLWARKNGRHGIAVRGMVESTGSEWLTANNGFIEKMAPGADLFFSGDATLSYGITARSAITGIFAGASQRSTRGQAAYALWIEPAGDGQPVYPGLTLSHMVTDGDVLVPTDAGLRSDTWLSQCGTAGVSNAGAAMLTCVSSSSPDAGE
ncbi:MAG: right-handed parallel beta-helix repeat-containing protein [Pseudomonadota bacterium]